MAGKLTIVDLLNRQVCFACRFSEITTVEMDNGELKRMLRCRRLDCDNRVKIDGKKRKEPRPLNIVVIDNLE